MNGEKIYTGTEALALRDGTTPGEWTWSGAYVITSPAEPPIARAFDDEGEGLGIGQASRNVRLMAASRGLATSVAHWEAHAKDETARATRWQEAHAKTAARAERAEQDRDAAIAHAAELEAALRVARSDLERLRADGRVELRERAERAEEALADERTARARAEAAMDERGLRLVAMVRERDALRAAVREYLAAEDAARLATLMHVTAENPPGDVDSARRSTDAGHRAREARDALRKLVTEAPDDR